VWVCGCVCWGVWWVGGVSGSIVCGCVGGGGGGDRLMGTILANVK